MTPASVLVVEDDRIVARDIHQQLARAGYEVVGSSATGEDAIKLAEKHRPDIVLMDVRLDGSLDGIQSANSIRSRYRIPVIFLTAYADDETVKRASQAEPFGYLLKPFEEGQLRTAIEMALYKHQAERKLRESERRYATTLASIGDAVIATDVYARITFMNPVAESLTCWSAADAIGQPITDVFRIVNEATRMSVEDPVAKVLRLGTIVGLANHTLLIGKDGRETSIDDCGSPIIDDGGEISGAVLIFRDIGHKR
jgi:PAS domain S-box-containing protein